MKKRLIAILMATTLVGSLLTGCGSSDKKADSPAASTTAPGKEDNTINIGVVASLTGGSAVYGEGAKNAVTMAAEEINASDSKYKVKIIDVVDDAGDSKQAINAYNSLEPKSPEAVVGAFFSSVTLPMAEIAKGQNMLLLAAGATNKKVTEVGPTIFRDCFIDPYQGKMAAAFAKEQGATKAAIIYAKDDDYSNGLKDAFVENAKANGIEIVYTGECTTKDTDFTAQASQAVQAGADFVFYPCFLDTVPLFVQQLRAAGYKGNIMGGDGWDGSDTTGSPADFDKCYFTNHYSSEDTAPAVKQFVTKYKEKYGKNSLNACAALYYDAIYMLVKAAENGGGTNTAALVRGMTGMTFTGVGGTFTIDANRNAVKSVVINTYENGKVKWLKTLNP